MKYIITFETDEEVTENEADEIVDFISQFGTEVNMVSKEDK